MFNIVSGNFVTSRQANVILDRGMLSKIIIINLTSRINNIGEITRGTQSFVKHTILNRYINHGCWHFLYTLIIVFLA